LTPINNPACTINPQPIRLSNSISDSNFNDNILETLVPNLMPNLNKLDLVTRRGIVAAERIYSRSLQDVARSIVRVKGIGR
jgi:hypothetical protein